MERRKLPPCKPCEKCGGKIVIESDYHPLCAKHYVEYLDKEHIELILEENNELGYKGGFKDVLIEIKKRYPDLAEKWKKVFEENNL